MDIQAIFQHAKELLLRDGSVMPTMFVQFAKSGMVLVAFTDFPYETTGEKRKAPFGLGMKIGKEYRHDEILGICFVTETWVAQGLPGEERQCAPSEDPNRGEVILAQVLNIEEKTISQSMHVAEILRAGDCIDLTPSEKIEEAHSNLLIAFLAGVSGAKLSPQEFTSILSRVVNQ